MEPKAPDGDLVFEILWPEGQTEMIDNNRIVNMGDIVQLGGVVKSIFLWGVKITPGEPFTA